MRSRPLVAAALALAAGLWTAREFSPPTWTWLIAAAAAVALAWTLIARRNAARLAAAMLLFFALGLARLAPICRPTLPSNHLAHWLGGRAVTVQGVVTEAAEPGPDGRASFVLDAQRLAVKENETRAVGKIRIYANRGGPKIAPGDTVRLRTTLRYLASPRTPGALDSAWEPATRGLWLQGRATSPKRLEVVAPAPFGVSSVLERIRARLRAAADSGPGWQPWLVRCLALGDSSRNDPLVEETFFEAGVIHVLVIAGLHIGVVAGLAFTLVWFVLTRRPRLAVRLRPWRWAAAVAAPAAIFYAVLAGGATSVRRACLTYVIMLFALYLGRRRDPLVGLSVAAIVILLLDPGALWTPGFQFSFAAVWGIFHWRKIAFRLDYRRPAATPAPPRPWLAAAQRWLLGSLVVSVAAWLATMPISLWRYGLLAAAAPLANLVAVPLFAVAALPSLLAGCLASFVSPTAAHVCWRATEFVMGQIFGSLLLLQRLGLRMQQLGRPSLAWVAAFFALFVAVPYLDRRVVRRFAAAGLALLIALPVGGAWAARHKTDLTLTMLDVGQGLSILVQTPGGKNLLIDGGPDPHGRVTAPFLAARGVRRLDAVVSTHPHPDHYEGLAPIVKRFAVGELWTIAMPRAFPEMGEWTALLAHARARGIPIRTLSRDDPPFVWNGLLVEPLNPPGDPPLPWEPNDRALALRLSWRGRTALIAADMEGLAEDSLLATGRDLRADLVQVAHHGSNSSSQPAFVEATRAAQALVPVGFQNQYRLPRREVVNRWREYGAKVWRTDLDGAIECTAGGGPWRCRSIAPPPSNPLLARQSPNGSADARAEPPAEDEAAAP